MPYFILIPLLMIAALTLVRLFSALTSKNRFKKPFNANDCLTYNNCCSKKDFVYDPKCVCDCNSKEDKTCDCVCSDKPFNMDGSPCGDKCNKERFKQTCDDKYEHKNSTCDYMRALFENAVCDGCNQGSYTSTISCQELKCQKAFIDAMADQRTGFFYTGFTYDPAGDIFYATKDAYQRMSGYCNIYDQFSIIAGMDIDYEPIIFNYNGRKWRIELWKGQYGMTTGAEIGIYVNDGFKLANFLTTGRYYDSVTDCEMLDMEFILCKNGWEVMHRKGHSWWLTGFKLGLYSRCEELKMYASVTIQDKGMLQAFVHALEKKGYKNGQICVDGCTVYLEYNRPKTHQSLLRKLFGWYTRWYTKLYCKIYQKATEDIPGNTLQKLAVLKNIDAKLTKKIMNMGIYSLYGSGDILASLPDENTFCEEDDDCMNEPEHRCRSQYSSVRK